MAFALQMINKTLRKQEEIVNSLTHGIGFIGAIALTVLLVHKASLHGDVWHIVSFSIFGIGMMLVFLSSTLYHKERNLRKKYRLNIYDHSTIYILIAATYTPITLVSIRGGFGWTLFGLAWGMAIFGIIFKIWFYSPKLRKLSLWLYIVMGWLILIAIVPILKNVPEVSLWYLLIGSLSYFSSTYFYLYKKIPFHHGIFHLLILGGSICHFFAFYFLI